MFKKISFKGIILGSLADVIGTNIWGFVLGIILVFQYHLIGLPPKELTQQMQNLILHQPIIIALNLIVGGGFTILGGYLSAKIAKHNELLNGTLASFLCVLFTLLAIGSNPIWNVLLGVIADPLLGFAGGYIQMIQNKKKSKKKHK